MRTARPPPLQNPSRSAHGRLRIHRGLVQSSSPPFRPRLSFTDQLRMEPANRKSNRKPNTVHRNGVAPERDEWARHSEGCYLLRTNISDWNAAQLRRTYIQLSKAGFRIHNSQLAIRPIWHQR